MDFSHRVSGRSILEILWRKPFFSGFQCKGMLCERNGVIFNIKRWGWIVFEWGTYFSCQIKNSTNPFFSSLVSASASKAKIRLASRPHNTPIFHPIFGLSLPVIQSQMLKIARRYLQWLFQTMHSSAHDIPGQWWNVVYQLSHRLNWT